MRIQVASDIHLFKGDPFELPDLNVDLFANAGDISHLPTRSAEWMFMHALTHEAVCTGGNHDFYKLTTVPEKGDPRVVYNPSYSERLKELQTLYAGSSVSFLENSVAYFGVARILGATLWTDFNIFGDGEKWVTDPPRIAERFSDYSEIPLKGESLPTSRPGRFTPRTARFLHARSVEWLQRELEKKHDGPTIVMSHHAPSLQSIPRRFRKDPGTPIFASDLDDFIRSYKIDLWIHGHVHERFDYQIGTTRVVCNPRGGIDDPCSSFDPEFVVTI